jgi:hypothetical protein
VWGEEGRGTCGVCGVTRAGVLVVCVVTWWGGPGAGTCGAWGLG